MSGPATQGGEPITDKAQLAAYLEAGCKPADAWRIGTEHEKFAFDRATLSPLPYEGPNGIKALLEGLKRFGWDGIYEGDTLIGLTSSDGGSVSLEPGGQLELSGAPLRTIHQTCDETQEHLRQVLEVCEQLGVLMLGIGFTPRARREDIHWMPKGRYRIMRNYMPRVGGLGLDMMLRTSTIQCNLDFSSEADMVKKFRVGLALQPVVTALFANSPFLEGRPNGFVSYRSFIWTDTDPDRTGDLPFVFEDGMGFERYVDYALDVPMYFVSRDGRYIDVSGLSFRDFMDGKLAALPGERPSMGDWIDHLSTIFPEVRLKRFLEMRGADGGPWNRICGLSALWTGLLYDQEALDAAWDMVKGWTPDERTAMRMAVSKTGLMTPFRTGAISDLAKEMIAIARTGLEKRARRDGWNSTEAHFLDPLQKIAEDGRSPARVLLERFHGEWNGSVDPVFDELSY